MFLRKLCTGRTSRSSYLELPLHNLGTRSRIRRAWRQFNLIYLLLISHNKGKENTDPIIRRHVIVVEARHIGIIVFILSWLVLDYYM